MITASEDNENRDTETAETRGAVADDKTSLDL